MGHTRAWQTVRGLSTGLQRIAALELDLAYISEEGGTHLEYRSLVPPDGTAHMRVVAEAMAHFGPQSPSMRSVLVVMRRGQPARFARRYPTLPPPSHSGSTIISADAGEVAVLAEGLRSGQLGVRGKRPFVVESTPPAAATQLGTILDTLWREERVFYYPAGKQDFRSATSPPESIDILVPCSASGGLLSEHVRQLRPSAAFNGGYFLWIDDETRDPYSFALDHVGLVVADGEVLSPPVFRRSALVATTRLYGRSSDEARYSLAAPRLLLRELSLANVCVRIGRRLVVHGTAFSPSAPMTTRTAGVEVHRAATNPSFVHPNESAFYNRMLGFGGHGAGTTAFTPSVSDRVECAVVGREICSMKEGGQSYIPANGFVISLPGRLAEYLTEALEERGHVVTYEIQMCPEPLTPLSGVQVGPQLARNGRRLEVEARLARRVEEYAPLDHAVGEHGVPPLYVTSERHISASIARLGLGIRPDARCFLALIEGSEPRTSFPEYDSSGASADDLVEFLLGLGCHDVVQLDGGGSATLFVDGRPIAKTADRNDIPFTAEERAVAGGWFSWDQE